MRLTFLPGGVYFFDVPREQSEHRGWLGGLSLWRDADV